MERLASLQREHGLEATQEDHYRHAQAWAAAGEPERAVEAAVRYLQSGGRNAERYEEALDLIDREGALQAAPAARASATEEAPAGASRVFDGMEFAWIPAGEFLMGSTSAEAPADERPVTRVRISRGFWLGKYEVTQDQWQAVMGTNPSEYAGCGRCPVECVSWQDTQGFIRQMNARARREPLPAADGGGVGVRGAGGGRAGTATRRTSMRSRGTGGRLTPFRTLAHGR